MHNKIDLKIVVKAIIGHLICTYIDIKNYISVLLINVSQDAFFRYAGMLFTVLMTVVLIKNYAILFNMLKDFVRNKYWGIIVFSLLGLFSFIFNHNFAVYKLVAYLLFLLLGIITVCTKNQNEIELENGLLDFQELIERDVKKKPIIISEKAVSYDLLNREIYIRELLDAVCSKKCGSHIIGLIGPWGSGKSTIINILKKRLYESVDRKKLPIIIDEFEPWIYGNQETFLGGLLDLIEKELGIRISYLSRLELLDEVCYGIKDTSRVLGMVSRFLRHIFVAGNVKQKICDYLVKNDQRLLIIIDNLDRAESSNVILMLKLLGTVLDIPNITYIISFDQQRMNEIMCDNKKINIKYLEKIINQEIHITQMDLTLFHNLVESSFKNMVKAHSIDMEGSYAEIFDYITERCPDLRQYKRFLNSVIPMIASNDNKYYIRDLIAIETIKFFDYEIYEFVRLNRSLFCDSGFHADYAGNSIEDEEKAQLRSIFEKGRAVQRILEMLFPEIHAKVINDMFLHAIEDKDSIKRNSRICDPEVFDLYFTYSKNEYYSNKRSVEKLVDMINGGTISSDDLINQINDKLNEKTVLLYNWFEMLKWYVNEIKEPCRFELSIALVKAVVTNPSINVYEEMLPKCALDASLTLLESLPFENDNGKIKEWCNNAYENYNFIVLNEIVNLCDGYRRENNSFVQRVKYVVKTYSSEKYKELLDSSDNIYTDKFFIRLNVIFILMLVGEEDFSKEYIKKCITKETAFNFLRDIVKYSVRSQGNRKVTYEYYFDKQEMAKLVGEIDLSAIIDDIPPRNELEGFLKEIYSIRNNEKYVIEREYLIKL